MQELFNLINAFVLTCCGCIKYQAPIFDVADRASVDLTLLLTFVVAGDVGVKGIRVSTLNAVQAMQVQVGVHARESE